MVNHLIACTISHCCAFLKLKHCRTYIVQYFLLHLNKELHYGEVVHEFCLTLYKNLITDLLNIAFKICYRATAADAAPRPERRFKKALRRTHPR